MIDRLLNFLVPFFAVSTILLGAIIFGGFLWSMLPSIIYWSTSNYVVAMFCFCVVGFITSFFVSIGRHD